MTDCFIICYRYTLNMCFTMPCFSSTEETAISKTGLIEQDFGNKQEEGRNYCYSRRRIQKRHLFNIRPKIYPKYLKLNTEFFFLIGYPL